MRKAHAARVLVIAMLTITASAVGHTPARAAAYATGSAKAGPGVNECGFSLSCTAFEKSCTIGPSNDIDASVRKAAVGGLTRPIAWSATVPAPVRDTLAVQPFSATCKRLGFPGKVRDGQAFAFPVGTAYVAVFPTDTWAQLTWTLL